VIIAVEFSLLICGISGKTTGFSSLRAWQFRHATTLVPGSFVSRSAVNVVVRSGGYACLMWRNLLSLTRRLLDVVAFNACDRPYTLDVVILGCVVSMTERDFAQSCFLCQHQRVWRFCLERIRHDRTGCNHKQNNKAKNAQQCFHYRPPETLTASIGYKFKVRG
jgi:hypothetical protein